jgi:2-iminobutanoate/2-iminopropanoate deaminase
MTRSGDQATRRAVSSAGAPAAVGPYSQALISGDLIFLSGQIPLDPATAQMIDGDIDVLTRRVLDNIGAVLDASGSSFDRVVKTTVYLADMADFPAMNEVYATYFPEPFPARSTVQAAALPRNARIEIDVIAAR